MAKEEKKEEEINKGKVTAEEEKVDIKVGEEVNILSSFPSSLPFLPPR